ncbi:hypothetical protein BS47DRAFT_1286982, partial [Hydnum rufescens UP504]
DYNIPVALGVNSDQTQVVFQQGSSMTYEKTGLDQVATVGQDEKGAFTLNVGISASGKLLPFQVIYASKSLKSLLNESCEGYNCAIQLGFHFESSMTDTYWATLDTMKLYVQCILVLYFLSEKESLQLPDNQECLWQIDIRPVHTSIDFWGWLHTNFPWIILEYIPGGCTGKFQACDVGFQHPLKQSIQHSQHADVITEVLEQLAKGVEAKDIILDTKLPSLCQCSAHWLVNADMKLDKPNIILKVHTPWVSDILFKPPVLIFSLLTGI